MLSLWREYKFYLIPPLFWAGICILLDFNGLFGQDAHGYYQYTSSFYQSLSHFQHPKDYFWGIGYPLLGAILSFITQNVLFSLLAISLLAYALIGILINQCLTLIFPLDKEESPFFRKIAIFILYFSAPFCIRMAVTVMSDMLAVLGTVVCFYGMTVFYYKDKNNALYLSIAGATLAILTRYPPGVLILPMLIALAYWVFIRKKYYTYLIATLIALTGLALHFWIKGNNIFEFTNHGSLYGWTLMNSFRRVLHTPDGIQYCTFPNILYTFGQFWHPAYLIFGVVLLCFIRKKDLAPTPIKIAITSIILYAIFLAGIPFQNMRFLLLSFPLVCLLLYPAFIRFAVRIANYGNKLERGIFILILLGQSVIAFKLLYDLRKRNHWEKEVARDLQQYKGTTLYTFDIDVALGSYPVPLTIINTWTEKLDTLQIGALYFAEEKTIESQWVDRNPYFNWQKAKNEYQLLPLKHYKNGWKLYRIEKKL